MDDTHRPARHTWHCFFTHAWFMFPFITYIYLQDFIYGSYTWIWMSQLSQLLSFKWLTPPPLSSGRIWGRLISHKATGIGKGIMSLFLFYSPGLLSVKSDSWNALRLQTNVNLGLNKSNEIPSGFRAIKKCKPWCGDSWKPSSRRTCRSASKWRHKGNGWITTCSHHVSMLQLTVSPNWISLKEFVKKHSLNIHFSSYFFTFT